MNKNMNTYKGWELIDEDRYTWTRKENDGTFTFIGLKQTIFDVFVVQYANYEPMREVRIDFWETSQCVYEEGYGPCPDGYMTEDSFLEEIESVPELIPETIAKCLFWQDYNNEDICKVHGWEKACTKVEGLLHIY